MAGRRVSAIAFCCPMILAMLLSLTLCSGSDSLRAPITTHARRLQPRSGDNVLSNAGRLPNGEHNAFRAHRQGYQKVEKDAFGAANAEQRTAASGSECEREKWKPISFTEKGLFDVINPTIAGDEKDELNWSTHQRTEGRGTETTGSDSQQRDQARPRALERREEAGQPPKDEHQDTVVEQPPLIKEDESDSPPVEESEARPPENKEDAITKPWDADWNPWKFLDENPLPIYREDWDEEEGNRDDVDHDPGFAEPPDSPPEGRVPKREDDDAPGYPGDDTTPFPPYDTRLHPGDHSRTQPGEYGGGVDEEGEVPEEDTAKGTPRSSTPPPNEEPISAVPTESEWSGSGVYEGTAITVNARWIDARTIGEDGIQLEYQPTVFPAPPVLRKVGLKSKWKHTIKIFVRTTRANFVPARRQVFGPPDETPTSGSLLLPWWANWSISAVKAVSATTSSVAAFLFGTGRAVDGGEGISEVKGPAITSIKNMLKQYRRFKRKHPGKPGELVIDFCKDEEDSSSAARTPSPSSASESSSDGGVRESLASPAPALVPSLTSSSPSGLSPSVVKQNPEGDFKTETEGPARLTKPSEKRPAQAKRQNPKTKTKRRKMTVANAYNILQTREGLALVNKIRDKMVKLFSSPSTSVQVLVSTGHLVITLPSEGVDRHRLKALLQAVQETFGDNIQQWSFSEIVQLRGVVPEPHNPPRAQMAAKMETLSGKSTKTSKKLNGRSLAGSMNETTSKKTPFEASMPTDSALESKLYGMYMITATHAWIHGEAGDGTVVAVVDSGISRHPDLDCNLWQNPYEQQDGRDDDGNGLVDDNHGYDFEENKSEPEDENGHGTHVAGIIGACVNGGGVVGGAPKTQLMALRFIDKGGQGSMANSIRALNYAIDHEVQVINNSWGGPQSTAVLRRLVHMSAVARSGKGILLINAAGNESSNNDINPSYPANWDQDNTISVAAIDINGDLADFSNYGKSSVDMAAPGVKIYSTKPGGDYQHMSGTSMATPHVSAVAALVFGAFLRNGYDAPAAEVKDIIRITASPVDQLKGVTRWGSIPHARDAVLMARMGGMFVQAKCEDMVFELDAGSAHVVDLHLMPYRQGNYTADLTFDVFTEDGYRLDQIKVPVKLVISLEPRQGNSDSLAAAAFSSVVSAFAAHPTEGFEELCRLQAKIHVAHEMSTAKIVIICLGVIASILVLVLVFCCCRNGQQRSDAAEKRRESVRDSAGEEGRSQLPEKTRARKPAHTSTESNKEFLNCSPRAEDDANDQTETHADPTDPLWRKEHVFLPSTTLEQFVSSTPNENAS
ncbi:UNVERIFIED_CONTAM: subtilisin SUB2 [Hammondia hammondi]|eukprot:XP_008883480.1 subtilisin SUB2 [Hammondia hammondi]